MRYFSKYDIIWTTLTLNIEYSDKAARTHIQLYMIGRPWSKKQYYTMLCAFYHPKMACMNILRTPIQSSLFYFYVIFLE